MRRRQNKRASRLTFPRDRDRHASHFAPGQRRNHLDFQCDRGTRERRTRCFFAARASRYGDATE
jgi:hypothetical protein